MQTIARSFKTIQKIFVPTAVPQVPGGADSRIRVPINGPEIKHLDPFIAVYYFDIKVPSGFGDHPHIGMETVTYITDGEYQYEDFHGHIGVMEKGHLQWMTAGKGLIHAERPCFNEKPSVGFQLFMNLPAKEKFCDAGYQEINHERVPVATKDGVNVKVLSGEVLGVTSPVYQRNPTLMLDIEMPPNSKYEQAIPKQWNAFGYVHEGKAWFGENKEEAETNATVILNQDDNEVLVIETREQGAKIYFTAAQPCNEPIAHFNGMILNTQEQIDKAREDFKNRTDEFADGKGWTSDIKKYLDELKTSQTQQQ